jgi:serine/threonine protein kinase
LTEQVTLVEVLLAKNGGFQRLFGKRERNMALETLQNGRYRFLRQLGAGGMGEVYLMEDSRVNRQVAIKVIRKESNTYSDSDATRLFEREAKAIAQLEHPNILPLYDYGEEALDEGMITYMVMPFCEEGSFVTWLRKRGGSTSLTPQDVAYFISQAADALQYAHDRQVLHLDVKSANFLLRANRKDPNHPILQLADFGVSRLGVATANSSRTVRGTATSMAPEQWSSEPLPATDQYALAVMAYELLVGQPPFRGNMEQLMFKHFQTPVPVPSSINPRLNRAIDEVLLRALTKRPEERFPSISIFASALERAVQSLPTQTVIRPTEVSSSDIRATLAISKTEAIAGTTRTLTLPGGRQISVFVPAGAYDGQVIQLPNQNDPSGTGLSRSSLILTLAVQQTEPAMFIPDTERGEQTLLGSSNPHLQVPSNPVLNLPPQVLVPPVAGTNPNPPPTIRASYPPTSVPASNPNMPTAFQAPQSYVQSTASTGANAAIPPTIRAPYQPASVPTSDPNIQSAMSPSSRPTPVPASNPNMSNVMQAPPSPDSDPNAPTVMVPPPPPVVSPKSPRPSSTNWRTIVLIGLAILVIVTGGVGVFSVLRGNQAGSSPNATATAISSNSTSTSHGPTATARANATATASVVAANAAATASVVAANPDPYGAGGKLTLYDPLSNNSQGYGWDEKGNSTGGNCKFTASGYDVMQSDPNYFNACFAESTSFNNFVYEVQMTIIKGDAGGLLFRGSSAGSGSYYYFNVFQNGQYEVTYCPPSNGNCTDIETPTFSAAIKQGLKQMNLLAVVANGSSITIYINHQRVISFKNGNASQGQIGMVASPLASNGHATEVVYTNAKVWTF